jgi:hypothetical protein
VGGWVPGRAGRLCREVFRVAFVRRPVLDRVRGGVGELTKTCPGLSGGLRWGGFSVFAHAL